MAERSFYFKSRIGEHDFKRRACSEFCNIKKGLCPFLKDDQNTKVPGIIRWTDVNKKPSAGDAAEITGYTADFAWNLRPEEHGSLIWKDLANEENPAVRKYYYEWIGAGYTCWGDGSGYEFDKMSQNIIGPEPFTESIYDITDYGVEHDALKFSSWNAWVEKLQYDYRFGRVSDTNAECVLFPNVDNPWMFTEYVFQGLGGDGKNHQGKIAWEVPEEYVIEPPLYNSSDLSLINYDMELEPGGDPEIYEKYNVDGTSESHVRQTRIVTSWSQLLCDADGNPVTDIPARDAGVRLYRGRIPVQCIKWGEHGNIPPHALDMTAPKDWFDPEKGAIRLRAVYDMNAGVDFRSRYDGILEWGDLNGSQAYVIPAKSVSFTKNSSGEKTTYSYSAQEGADRIELDMPCKMVKGKRQRMVPTQKLMPSDSRGEYCHGGCQHCIGVGGTLKCKWLEETQDAADIRQTNEFFVPEYCMSFGAYGASGGQDCPHYLPGPEHPAIATYSYGVQNYFSVSDMNTETLATSNAFALMGLAIGGGLLGLLSAMSLLATEVTYLLEIYQSLSSIDDLKLTNNVRYEPTYGTAERPKLNTTTIPDSFGKGVQIVPGTGKFAIDSEENANVFSGGDTNVYNDINTLSFPRFFCSVMHCASQQHCNLWEGKNQKQGYEAGKKAGGTGECRYYKGNGIGCPYNGVPKRTVEFAQAARFMSNFLPQVAELFQSWCDRGRSEDTGRYYFDFHPREGNPEFGDIADVYVTAEAVTAEGIPCSSEFGGCSLIQRGNAGPYSGRLLLAKFRTASREIKVIENGREVTRTSYSVVDSYYWFLPLTDTGKRVSDIQNERTVPVLKQHWDTGILDSENDGLFQGYWLCKTRNAGGFPTRNTMMVDNDEKFFGGWHPEYKDYGKIGEEFMQTIDEDQMREKATGDYIPNASGLDYVPVENPKSQRGYWVDATGEYITDERTTGVDESAIASEADREGTGGGGSATCISFRKSNTTIDPNGERKLAKTINGAVYSNDPYQLIWYVYPRRDLKLSDPEVSEIEKKSTQRPQFQDPEYQDKKYYAPCYMRFPLMLPTMRAAWHCPKCDYYLPFKYALQNENCPWCGTLYERIDGSTGGNESEWLEEGQKWGERIPNASVMKKFFKIYALGNADVWAPAGTCVRTDAYFWRHQTQINNAVKSQIYHRLGSFANESGYQFDKMSAQSEMTLGLPEGIGKYAKMSMDKSLVSFQNGRYGYLLSEGSTSAEVSYNPAMPYSMLPMLTDDYRRVGESPGSNLDESIIAPYTKYANDALKMLNIREMTNIRNAFEPMYGYVYDAIPGDYPTKRASYDQRERIEQPIIYQHRRPSIKPFVLATTSDLKDSYQRYRSGEYAVGSVKEFFPSGYTWWFMHQYIGGRSTALEGGYYHMDGTRSDDGGGSMGGTGGEFTLGKLTTPYATLPLYGLLPLDKEIVKAYLIFETQQCADPSKDPVGIPWGYGFLSDIVGGVSKGSYMYCHYHAFTKNHRQLRWRAVDDKDPSKGGWWAWDESIGDGYLRHFHGDVGEGDNVRYDENGNKIVTLENGTEYNATIGLTAEEMQDAINEIRQEDESSHRLWGADSQEIEDDRDMYYRYDFGETMAGIPGVYDYSFHRNVGTPKTAITGFGDQENEVIGYGYLESFFTFANGFRKYNLDAETALAVPKFEYLLVDEENNLVLKYPESRIWKEKTSAELEEEIDLYKVDLDFGVSNGTEESLVSGSFSTYASELSKEGFNADQKNITSYFGMEWTNTRSYVYEDYRVDRKQGVQWESPVIFQDDDGQSSLGIYNLLRDNKSRTVNATKGTVAVDITDLVKLSYDNRVMRSFICSYAGASYDDACRWRFYQTRAEGGLAEIDDDVRWQNAQVENPYDEASYLLTDGVAYPKLSNLSQIPEVDSDGDKYEISEMSARIVLVLRSADLNVAQGINDKYKVTVGKTERNGTVSAGEYQPQQVIDMILKRIFPNAKSVARISRDGLVFEVVLPAAARIHAVESNWFAASLVGEYPLMCNRIISAPPSMPGYTPENILGDPFSSKSPGWFFRSYLPYTENITIDLLRAPLCIWQRDYRRTPPHVDYSSAKCPNRRCDAHLKGVALAANLKNGKFFDPKSDECPLCGAELDEDDAIRIPGDGIMTYRYDEPFSENPYWTGIYMKPIDEIECNYAVSAKYSEHENWHYVASASAKRIGGETEIAFQSPYADETKESRKGYLHLKPQSIRARYLQISCTAKPKYLFHQFRVSKINDYEIEIEGDFANMEGFTLAGIDAVLGSSLEDDEEMNEESQRKAFIASILDKKHYNKDIDDQNAEIIRLYREAMAIGALDDDQGLNLREYDYDTPYGTFNTIVSSRRSEDGSKLKIEFSHSIEDGEQSHEYLKFYAIVYEGGIDKFGVYGFHYKTKQGPSIEGAPLSSKMFLTVTEPFDEMEIPLMLQKGITTCRIDERPTQIDCVSLVMASGTVVELSEAPSPSGLTWETKSRNLITNSMEDSYEYQNVTVEYLEIVGGSYYYDVERKKIILPQENRQGIRVENFEAGLNSLGIGITSMPTKLAISHFSGNGKSVTLHFIAEEQGPSYMLEKNAINSIDHAKSSAGAFPPNGVTCKMIDIHNQIVDKRAINWMCYNNVPSTIGIDEQSHSRYVKGVLRDSAGVFELPKFNGAELVKKKIPANQLFYNPATLLGVDGEECTGTCETDVTFTGGANKILAGKIVVYAPPTTTQVIDLGNGQSVTYTERTGGMQNGFVTACLRPSPVEHKRKTVCYPIPKIVVYAKDKNPYE